MGLLTVTATRTGGETAQLAQNVLQQPWEPPRAQNPRMRAGGGDHTFLQRALVSPHSRQCWHRTPQGLGSPLGSASTGEGPAVTLVLPDTLVPHWSCPCSPLQAEDGAAVDISAFLPSPAEPSVLPISPHCPLWPCRALAPTEETRLKQ